jgi:hypothetical protein
MPNSKIDECAVETHHSDAADLEVQVRLNILRKYQATTSIWKFANPGIDE